ncbi:gag-Pol polyprotein [Nephila pilipes]|uniref:Gag-Pol polyprotein n=1 Tax=Nephila pilipes TaxID=299642 RepID=A0A8X6IBH6_NEPPI|nr:gag-Pol polyprotein [Nephila pilipes]
MVAEANGWNSQVKAFHLAASLRGDAADILETLPEAQRHDFQALSGSLELRFGRKCTKEFRRLQLKYRYQKVSESLQELAAYIQRLSHLAFSDYPVETRQDLALQHFIDSVRDSETQKALRLADAKDIGSALVYAHKMEAPLQATRRDRHSIKAVAAIDSDSHFLKQIEGLRRKIRCLEELTGVRNTKIQCWTCGAARHIRRNCPTSRDGGNNLPLH